MLRLGGLAAGAADAGSMVDKAVADGSALDKLREMVVAQGGDPAFIDDPDALASAREVVPWEAPRAGVITSVDSEQVGAASCVLGVGREKFTDAVDPAVGFEVMKRVGERVEAGEPILEIHANDTHRLAACQRMLSGAYAIGDDEPAVTPLVLEEIS